MNFELPIWLQLCVLCATLFLITSAQSTTLSWKERARLEYKKNYEKYILRNRTPGPPTGSEANSVVNNNVEPTGESVQTRDSLSGDRIGADSIQGDVTVRPNSLPAPGNPPPSPQLFTTSSVPPPRPQTSPLPPAAPAISSRAGVPTAAQPPPPPPPRPQPVAPVSSFSSSAASAFAGGGASSFASAGGSFASSSAGGSSASASAGAGGGPPARKSPVGLIGQVVSGLVRPITSILPAPLGPKGKNPGIVGSVVTGLIDELEGNLRVIYPGTLWCGQGTAARRLDDVGVFRATDKCCRSHDRCKDSIGAGMTAHGLRNSGTFTRSHCDCDEEFYSCLHRDGSLVSLKVGTTYFNILQPKCFRQVGCSNESQRNTTCNGEWRWFSNRLF